jgi:regulator of RNase E activity RraA
MDPAVTTAPAPDDEHLRASLRRAAIASLSDALDALLGVPACMLPDMRPVVNGGFTGPAATALLRPASREVATRQAALRDSVGMIDASRPGEVGVIVLEDGIAVAAIGGLMAEAARARGMAALVCDAAVRDVAELRAIGMPVCARGISAAASVGRHVSVARDVEVSCAGVRVRPGDWVVGGEDGVIVVPATHAAEVAAYALELDERESRMMPLIREARALRPVAEKFNRG